MYVYLNMTVYKDPGNFAFVHTGTMLTLRATHTTYHDNISDIDIMPKQSLDTANHSMNQATECQTNLKLTSTEEQIDYPCQTEQACAC